MGLRTGLRGTVRKYLGVGIILVSLLVVGATGLAIAQGQQGTQHENPDELGEDSNPEELERWFGSRMGEMHVDCSEGLAVGNFDACEDLDEKYESYLERYVEVERETTGNESERQAEEFNETRNEQREFADRLREFNQTRQEYEEARQNGNEARTRTKAREMRRQADRINELGGNVSSGFRQLDNSTAADLEQAAIQTEETTAEVGEIASQAEGESLEPIEFAVDSEDEASFVSPANVSGLVRTTEWSAVSGGEVVVRDDAGFQANATIDEDGRWSVPYRPTRTQTGTTTLQARYVPEDTSPYMDANATTSVVVAETSTTIQLENVTEQSSYGENVTAVGTLSAAGEPAENITVGLNVSETVVGTARTDSDGRFEVTGPLPASVPPGNVSLNVQGGEAGTALSPSTESRSMSISETETTISAKVDYDGDEAHVSGQLQTVNGDPVGDQPVTIERGRQKRTVTTDSEGAYSFTVDRSESRQDAVVSYDSSGGNLEGSQTSVSIAPQSNDSFAGVGTISEALGAPDIGSRLWSVVTNHPLLSAFLAGVVLLNVVFWSFAVWRRWGPESNDESTESEGSEGLEPAVKPVTSDTASLATARAQLEGAPSTAVQLAFANVRTALGMDDARTHWEVYQAASDRLDGDRRDALRTVTEAFEAATFSPEGVDSERAGAAVDDAERCLAATDGGDYGHSRFETGLEGGSASATE